MARPAAALTARGRRLPAGAAGPLAALALLAAAAAAGPALVAAAGGGDPTAIGDVLSARLLPPLARDGGGHLHLLGTDRFGRDLLARSLVAARLSLLVGVLGSVLSGGIGLAAGALAGWAGGAVDVAITALADALLAVPRLVLLLVVAALWGPGVGTTVAVLALTGWMGVARLVRAEVLGVRRRDHVEAARALGASPARLLWRHVVPNALGAATVATTLGVGNAILLESGLSFLGLGVQPPAPSWGNLIAGGRDLIVTAPWVSLVPGVLLVATVLACTLLGDAVEGRGGSD